MWRAFEETIAEVERQLVGKTAAVTRNEHIVGRSERKRQCDVTIRSRIGSHRVLVVLECKKQRRPVSIGQAEAFRSKLEDVGANLGVLVSASGFSSGAAAVSRNYGIRLMSYRDARAEDWSKFIKRMTAPKLIWTSIKLLRCFAQFPNGDTGILGSLASVQLATPDGPESPASLVESMARQLHARPPGRITLTLAFDPDTVFLEDRDAGKIAVAKLIAELEIEAWTYDVPMELGEGEIYDDVESGHIAFGKYSTVAFEWEKLVEGNEGRRLSPEEYRRITEESHFSHRFLAEPPMRFIRVQFVQTAMQTADDKP